MRELDYEHLVRQGGEEIGRGSFGVVLVAKVAPFGRVAVKLARPPRASVNSLTRTALDEFQREAEMMESVRHPNIIQIYGVAKSLNHDQFAIVMPLMQTNLHKALSDRLLQTNQLRLSAAFQAAT